MEPHLVQKEAGIPAKGKMRYLIQGVSSAKIWKMLLQLFLFAITTNVVSSQLIAPSTANCTGYFRRPDYSDITVDCGTNYISLAIQICPVLFSGFNESQLILNNIMNDQNCIGTVDNSVAPPVVRYTFPINITNGCGSTLTTTNSAGTGIFSDFSNIQTVNISGVVRSYDSTIGVVTYNTDLKYYYSCSYPLEYLINNSRIDVSSSAIAVRDRNGSFISTLSLKLYSDPGYTTPLVIPAQGIELRTTVYVLVTATNLTAQYFVLLDRCYATVARYPSNSTFFNFFVGCNKDVLTNLTENGASQNARFSFPAFRFTEQRNQSISSYYLHCITRLCEISACQAFKSCPTGRRRREVDIGNQNGITDSTTLVSPLIVTKPVSSGTSVRSGSDPTVGLGVAVGILAFVCVGILMGAAVFSKKHIISSKMLCS